MGPTTENGEGSHVVLDKVSRFLTGGGVAVARLTGRAAAIPARLVSLGKGKGISGLSISLPGKGLFTGGILKKWGSESSSIKVNIAKAQRKIEELYLEIGKLSSRSGGGENVVEQASSKDMLSKVRSYEGQIQNWETRLNELAKERATAKDVKFRDRVGVRRAVSPRDVESRVRDAIRKAMKTAEFGSNSEKAIFEKVSNDLLDEDVEIKLLAAAELGKIPNPASIPVLKEALGFGNAYVMSEIVHALIKINHPSCLPIFKGNANDQNYRVRLGCLKGIYKVAGADSAEYLINGLRDEHQEVRRSAATFLGWIGIKDATPALIQTLKDPDQEVTDAAVMSLSILRDPSSVMPLIRALEDSNIEVREKIVHAIERITGKSVEFELDASGEKLKNNVERLKDWWRNNKMADVEESLKSVEAEGAVSGVAKEVGPGVGTETKVKETSKAEAAEKAPVVVEKEKTSGAAVKVDEGDKTEKDLSKEVKVKAEEEIKTVEKPKAEVVSAVAGKGTSDAANKGKAPGAVTAKPGNIGSPVATKKKEADKKSDVKKQKRN